MCLRAGRVEAPAIEGILSSERFGLRDGGDVSRGALGSPVCATGRMDDDDEVVVVVGVELVVVVVVAGEEGR
jgi:hypothetical protein